MARGSKCRHCSADTRHPVASISNFQQASGRSANEARGRSLHILQITGVQSTTEVSVHYARDLPNLPRAGLLAGPSERPSGVTDRTGTLASLATSVPLQEALLTTTARIFLLYQLSCLNPSTPTASAWPTMARSLGGSAPPPPWVPSPNRYSCPTPQAPQRPRLTT